MKIKITRQSFWHDEKPCEEAVRMDFPIFKNEITKEGLIARQMGEVEEWGIEISSIEELIDFIKRYGRVVVDEDSIDIYDDYRE